MQITKHHGFQSRRSPQRYHSPMERRKDNYKEAKVIPNEQRGGNQEEKLVEKVFTHVENPGKFHYSFTLK